MTNNSAKQRTANFLIQRFAVLALVIFFASYASFAALQPTVIVNVPLNAPVTGGSDSLSPIISPDGRYVLFASLANNLVLLDTPNPAPQPMPPVLNVFLRDRVTQTTRLVSISVGGAGGGNGDSMPGGISDDGRFAVFTSSASNLVSDDTNSVSDVFVRDLFNQTTMLVSVSTNGFVGNGNCRSAVMTPDGRYVAFVSEANNLVPDDLNGIPDVFVRDLQIGTTTMASFGAQSANSLSRSELPIIASDGRYVVFYSSATNLVAGVTNIGEVYVRDLLAGTTIWVSTDSHSLMLQLRNNSRCRSSNHAMSSDGRYVVYEATPLATSGIATSITSAILLRYDLTTGITDVVNSNVVGIASGCEFNEPNVSMTPDGRFVAFVANVFGTNGTATAVEVWDGNSNSTVTASQKTDQSVSTNSLCDWPAISSDGRFVAFVSNDTNLTANPVVAGFHVYVRDLQLGTNYLIDADVSGIGSTPELMTVPRLSDNGDVVVFDSPDGQLIADDNNRANDVFARNVQNDSTELVSAGLSGLPSHTPNASSIIFTSCISSNGQYVAFWSEANDLIDGDANGFFDVFVRDLITETNILVSANLAGTTGNGVSKDAVLSSDGRYVAFVSSANDLVTGDANGVQDVFLRDLQSGITFAVSVSTNASELGDGESSSPVISGDGRFVIFVSQAGNLVPGGIQNSGGNLFRRDTESGTTVALTGFQPGTTVRAINAAMSGNGDRVAYSVQTGNIQTATLRVWDESSGGDIYTNIVNEGIYRVGISPDGDRIISYSTNLIRLIDLAADTLATFTNAMSRSGFQFSADSRYLAYTASTNLVFLYDFVTASNLLISTSGISDSPTVSADGRFVAFRSTSKNLVAGDTNNLPDIFLYDRESGTTECITVNPYGNWPANSLSFNPVFSADGRTLVWQSWATDLVGQSFNPWCNIFASKAFTANPATPGQPFDISSFGFSSLAGFGSSAQTPALAWPVLPGTNYVIQFKNLLTDAEWQNLVGNISIIGNLGFATDLSPDNNQRYYRVVAY